MEVILRQDVKGLGTTGDVVNVAGGYARNFLIPRGLAYPATESARKQVELEKKRQEKKKLRELEDLKKVAEEIESISCTVTVQANEEGRLYASVTPQMIAEAMKNEGVDIPASAIEIEEPIKELGVYEFKVRFAPDVQATSKVWVVEG